MPPPREHFAAMLEPDTASFDSIVHVIQLSLAPIFLLTAVASLLGVFTTRLARISDQVKTLSETKTEGDDAAALLRKRLSYLKRRVYALDAAVILATVSGVCTCGTVLALYLGILRARATASILFLLFGAAILCTIGALAAFLVEVMWASRGIRADVAHRVGRMEW